MESIEYFVVGVCYRSQVSDENELGEMFGSFKLACDTNRSVLVMGDFNYPDINWNTLRADINGNKFLKLVMDCYLEQHVSVPTRGNNILDLILTTEIPIKDPISMLPPVENSDHDDLLFSIDCSISQEKEKKYVCYNQADYISMREFVKEGLSYIDLSEMSVGAVWYNFNEVMQEAIERFVPYKKITNKSRNPLWMTMILRMLKPTDH